MKLGKRIELENRIVRKVIKALVDDGYVLSVDDGGDELALRRSIKKTEIFEATDGVDECTLYAEKDGGRYMVFFVYGNDGWDVINDYSIALESTLSPVFEYCKKIEMGG